MTLRKRRPDAARRAELRINAERALLPSGEPRSEHAQAEFFELYKIMVASSEALVARRQGVNTFFVTINGLLLTAIGLFLRGGGHVRLQAGGIVILALTGIGLCVAWRTLLISFGQLNTGKFTIITSMEQHLSAAIYAAEWEALGRGKDDSIYRSFTAREAWVPLVLGLVYAITLALSGAVWIGIWHIGNT